MRYSGTLHGQSNQIDSQSIVIRSLGQFHLIYGTYIIK